MLSVIVVLYDMQREAPRTLFTLSPEYQINAHEDEYEVIVVENGSSMLVGEDRVRSYGKNFTYLNVTDGALPSPCRAINDAVCSSTGNYIGVLIDGARMASPGLISHALLGLSLKERAVVATLGWHLGPKPQPISIQEGYCREFEDQLLDRSAWREDGYNLFSISSLSLSSSGGYFAPIAESNAIFMRRVVYDELKGFDESFSLPGGGYANLDFFKRACELQRVETVVLLGEGTFHQVHGGIAANALSMTYVETADAEYRKIRGCPFEPPRWNPLYLGRPASQAIPWIRQIS